MSNIFPPAKIPRSICISVPACLVLLTGFLIAVNFHSGLISIVAKEKTASLFEEAYDSRSQGPAEPRQDEKLRLAQIFGKMPLSFEANQGQAPNRVKFVARQSDSHIFLTSTEIRLELRQNDGSPQRKPRQIRIKLTGANPRARLSEGQRLPGSVNYLIGGDPDRWRTDIPTYAQVRYEEVYPGVDICYYGNQHYLEYDFLLRPGADHEQIRFSLKGIRHRQIDEFGDLVLDRNITLKKPTIYQDVDGVRQEIAGAYRLYGRRSVGFQVGEYDKTKPLVIDPVLAYTRVISGDGANVGNGIAVDPNGNAYIVGTTSSLNFPTVNPFQAVRGGFIDVSVTKLDPNGNIVYSTYLGGSNDDIGRGIAIDPNGNAYVTGWTFSANFPTANAFQAVRNTTADAFVTKLNPSGSGVAYSTFLGGSGDDRAYAIAVDPTGNAYITGQTFSTNFPTANASQAARNGTGDVFVTKFNSAGSALTFSTYLGGAQSFEIGNGIAADSDGNSYVVGQTASTDFPVTNAFQTTKGDTSTSSTFDAFLTRFNSSGTRVSSTYLGGSLSDIAYGVALDASRNIYLTGQTGSFDFPTKNALQPAPNGNGNQAFVTEFNPAGSELIYSTFFGGNADNTAFGIAVDPGTGKAVITGKTNSPDFPAVRSLQSVGGGGIFQTGDGAASWNYSNTGLVSPFGSSPAQNINGLAVDPFDSSIYAATTSGIFKSDAGVLPWKAVNQDRAAYSVKIDPQNPSVVYAGNFGGISKSTDRGSTWTRSTTGLPSETVNDIVVDPANGSLVFAATGITGGGVYKSTDGGITWAAANTGLPNLGANAVIVDAATPSTMYAGVGSSTSATAGVYKSTNSGVTWTRMSSGLSNLPGLALTFDPTNAAIYAATTQGLYKSINGASSWTQVVQTAFSVLSVAVDPRNASTIYIGSDTSSGQGVFKSTDGGDTWTAVGLTGNRVTDLVIDPFTSVITAACGMLSTTDPSTDMFIAALDTGGSSLLFSSYYGGTGRDEGHGIGLDAAGNIYFTGISYSADLPNLIGMTQIGLPDSDVGVPMKPEASSIPVRDRSTTTTCKTGGSLGTDCPPVTLNIPKPSCEADVMCNKTVYVHGGTPEWILSRSGGVMPPGLELTSDGSIQGVPTQPGTYNFTVDVVDSRGCVGFKDITFTVHPKTVVPVQIEKQPAEDAYDPVNKTITFLVTVANNSGAFRDVIMNDEALGHPTSVTGPPGWTCVLQATDVVCKRENMPIGAATFTVVMEALRYEPGDQFVNTAAVRADNGRFTDRAAVVFTIPTAPTITSVTPSSGPVGTSCEIDGTGFCQGASTCTTQPTVKFNGTQAPLTCPTTDTEICTQVPVGATTGDLCVDTAGGRACTPFTVTASPSASPPTITKVTPTVGPVETACVIEGQGFCDVASSCATPPIVKFNGTQAPLTCTTTNTEICTKVPVGATSGNLCVGANGGEACAPFTVTATITGRVLSANGQGLRGATVTLTDVPGAKRTAISNALGIYKFEGVVTNAAYSISARSKRFRFLTFENRQIVGDSTFDFLGSE